MITLNEIKNNPAARDIVFIETLKLFEHKPLNILEIGCLRDINSRKGDGWSSVFWAEYVTNFGGKFVTTNIVQQDIDVCKSLIESLFPNTEPFSFLVMDGKSLIDNRFELIYLDGGDDPHETLDQFNKCDLEKSFVLVDDVHTKGIYLPVNNLHTLFRFDNGHLMALFKKQNARLVREIQIHV